MVLVPAEEPAVEFKHEHRCSHLAESQPLLSPSVTGKLELRADFRVGLGTKALLLMQHPAALPPS